LAESLDAQAGEAAKQILDYFVRNPGAADNLEGIARWRLLETMVQRSLAETERAIRWLVAEGFLCVKEVPGSGKVFLLNRENTGEVNPLEK
jgi:hypothetical protein